MASLFIASSDAGHNLMRRDIRSGATDIGTSRNIWALGSFAHHPGAHLLEHDVERPLAVFRHAVSEGKWMRQIARAAQVLRG